MKLQTTDILIILFMILFLVTVGRIEQAFHEREEDSKRKIELRNTPKR